METFSALLACCGGTPLVIGGFPSQRPVTLSFDVFICAWTGGWANNRDAGDLRRHHAHHDGTVMKSEIFKLIKQHSSLGTPCELAPRRMLQILTDKKSTLAQVMAWCRQATSHYLSQRSPSFLSPYGVIRQVNSWKPGGAYMRQWAIINLTDMACRLFGAKPWHKPVTLGTNFSSKC